MSKSNILNAHTETPARSITKTITYRVIIVISIFIISLITTGKLSDAATITGISAVTGTIIYYLHERVWSRVKWGRIR